MTNTISLQFSGKPSEVKCMTHSKKPKSCNFWRDHPKLLIEDCFQRWETFKSVSVPVNNHREVHNIQLDKKNMFIIKAHKEQLNEISRQQSRLISIPLPYWIMDQVVRETMNAHLLISLFNSHHHPSYTFIFNGWSTWRESSFL